MIKISIVLTRQRPSLRMEIRLILHMGPAEANNSLFLLRWKNLSSAFASFFAYTGVIFLRTQIIL